MVRHRADTLVKEGDQVKATLDKAIQDEQALQAEAGRTPAEKKASQDRQTRLQGARNHIDESVAQSQAMLKDLEKRNAAIQKEYRDAFESLKSAIDAKARAAKK
jgi:predicted nuclease with TOPRIM domain